MPNWTTTMIKGRNLDRIINKKGERVFAEGGDIPVVDFERIVPRPESLLLVSSPPDLDSIFCYVSDGFKNVCSETIKEAERIAYFGNPFCANKGNDYFHKIAKEKNPDDEVSLSFSIDGDDKKTTLYEKGRIYVDNMRLYGAPTWYEWSCANWGVKWNASDSGWSNDGDSVYMDTAWNMPYGFFEALAEECPDAEIYIIYSDEDYGSGCGVARIEDGKFKWLDFNHGSVEAIQTAQFLQGDILSCYDDEELERTREENSEYWNAYDEALAHPITHIERFVSKYLDGEEPV